MTAKDYLSQARYLDMRINSKVEQIESLNELATKCTSTITGMPHNPSASTSLMADAVCKIVDLQNELGREVQKLVDLKKDILTLIKSVPNHELQTLLEKRYLCFQSWEQIAVDMYHSIHHLYKLHNTALEYCEKVLKLDT